MENTLIEWAHHTLNWWWGCEKVSEACRHCYAEVMAKLFGRGRCVWGKGGKRWIRENAMRDARKLHAISKASGEMQRIFVNSMSDTFEDHPGLHAARADALAATEAMPHASWLLLTKRPENVRRMVPAHWLENWPGGESGLHARAMHPDWARSLRDQCGAAGVPFHFKQWGGKDKKAAGRLLDGRTWDEAPK